MSKKLFVIRIKYKTMALKNNANYRPVVELLTMNWLLPCFTVLGNQYSK